MEENNFFKKVYEHQFARYLVIGVINTVIAYVAFQILTLVTKTISFLNYQTQSAVAFVFAQFIGIVVSYVLNSKVTFKRKLSVQGFFAFAGPLIVLQLVVSGGGMYMLTSVGMDRNVAFVLLTVINVFLGFILTKISLNKFTKPAE